METPTTNIGGNDATLKRSEHYARVLPLRTSGEPAVSIIREIGGLTLTDISASSDESDVARDIAPRDDQQATTTRATGEYVASTGASATDVTPQHLWREASQGLTRISIDPAASNGRPMIRGTRIGVAQLMDELTDLGSVDAVVREFDGTIEPTDVQEALTFVARIAR